MEATVNQPVKSKRDIYKESLASRYPDKSYETDDDLFGQAYEDNENNEKALQGYRDREKGISEMFSKDPRVGKFFSGVKKGESPDIMLIRLYGKDIADAVDDPAKMEEIAAANKEYLDRLASNQKMEDEYKANLEKSLSALSAAGMSDDEIDKCLEKMGQVALNFVKGNFTVEDVKTINNALNYDSAVADAAKEGEVKGRNERIVEKLRTKKAGDGLPSLAQGGSQVAPNKPSMPDMGALNDYGDENQDIWGRGNFKRIKKG